MHEAGRESKAESAAGLRRIAILARMKGSVGDTIVVESERVSGPVRVGVIEEVLKDQPPRYQVRWQDATRASLAPRQDPRASSGPSAGSAWRSWLMSSTRAPVRLSKIGCLHSQRR